MKRRCRAKFILACGCMNFVMQRPDRRINFPGVKPAKARPFSSSYTHVRFCESMQLAILKIELMLHFVTR